MWLPYLMQDSKFIGNFIFSGGSLLHHRLHPVDELPKAETIFRPPNQEWEKMAELAQKVEML